MTTSTTNLTALAARAGLSPVGDRPSLSGYLRALWDRRSFMLHVPVGELRTQNMDTVLGNVWHLMNPLLLLGVYFLVFGVLIRGTRGGLTNFLGFLALGIFLYQYSQKSITQGATSIVSNEGLIRSLTFPRAILPLSAVVEQTLAALPAFGVMLLFVLLTGEHPSLTWLVIFPVLALMLILNTGAALIAARLTSLFRDFDNLLPFVFRLLFYGSGVIFPVTRFVSEDSPFMILFTINPLYAAMTILRQAMMAEITAGGWGEVVSLVVWSFSLLVGGFIFFYAGEREYGRG